MDLELLRTFLEVSRLRHFGQAGEALHLTQAAISARIRQLESLLGVRLFDRVRRDLRLTPEGHRLVRHADLLIAEWRKARQEVDEQAKVELALLITSDSPSKKEINSKIDQVLKLKGEKMHLAADHKVEVRKLLTTEQRVSFDTHVLKKAYRGKKGHKCRHR